MSEPEVSTSLAEVLWRAEKDATSGAGYPDEFSAEPFRRIFEVMAAAAEQHIAGATP